MAVKPLLPGVGEACALHAIALCACDISHAMIWLVFHLLGQNHDPEDAGGD